MFSDTNTCANMEFSVFICWEGPMHMLEFPRYGTDWTCVESEGGNLDRFKGAFYINYLIDQEI